MPDQVTTYISAGAFLPEGAWPSDILGGVLGEGLLDGIAYEGGDAFGTLDNWGFDSRLRVITETVFEVPLVQGFALVLGNGPLSVSLEGSGITWNSVISADVMRFRLPRNVFQPVIEKDGKLVEDPDETHFVEIDLPFTLLLSSNGNVDAQWPSGTAQPLVLPRCLILPGVVIGGQLSVSFADGKFKAADAILDRFDPNTGATTPMSVVTFHADPKSFALQWKEHDLNGLLRQLAPQLVDEGQSNEIDITMRVVFGAPIREIRLDWVVEGGSRTFRVPGAGIEVPDGARLTLLSGAGEPDLVHVAFAITLDPAHEALKVFSDFPWERDESRETSGSEGSDGHTLELTAKPNKPASLVLIDWKIDSAKLPTFLRQVSGVIPELDLSNPDTLSQATAYQLISLKAEDWAVDLHVNLATLPFLQGGSSGDQFLEIDPTRTKVDVRLAEEVIHVDLGLNVNIGPMQLQAAVPLEFNWETFAFKVVHELGLDLMSTEPTIGPDDEHLGLSWKFQGAPVGGTPQRYHFFKLTTHESNYKLVQAPGAVFTVEFTQISEDGVGFEIRNFELSPKGISLDGDVIDRPAKLNGLDTQFNFSGTRLSIKENQITDFTLNGSGAVPPDLVGDATAAIQLQMAQENGKLTLKSGGAQIKGSNLLHCEGTRFDFSIRALGLQFVNDGKFHLYFTLTGSAKFKLSAGDDQDGALALLPNIQIDLVDCPLAGDTRVLAKHISFFVELPKPISFPFLASFEMELRGIGFVPQADVFDGDGAMLVAGQLKFAQGAGDAADSRPDVHKLYIGLPKKGSSIPRIHFTDLPVNLNFGAAFQLNGTVEFVDEALEKGFVGQGSLAIQGLPTFAGAFAFLRVRRDKDSPWVRAWFIYVEMRKISVEIQGVSIFLREVGLGFGYRYTLASIKAADQANDVGELIKQLTVLSRTQGDLSKRDRWAIDIEDKRQDPRWTVAFRVLMSQTSAAPSPLTYDQDQEKNLSCLYVLDAVAALRSDLTFVMSARGWLFANYYDYVSNYKGLQEKPVVTGFVLLTPRKKRLLAHVASNPGGQFGAHPVMPDTVQRALAHSLFSATLLLEPGLLHFELGWPNQLQWSDNLGPLKAQLRGGFIFRVTGDELVTGVSFLAHASLEIKAGASAGSVGVSVSARANVAFGGRRIGLLSLRDPRGSSVIYGGIGIEAMIRVSVELKLKIKVAFVKITKTWRFSLTINFTASLELGIVGISTSGVGVRGNGRLSVSAMGRHFSLGVNLSRNPGAVSTALARTRHVLNLGLEASEVEAIPGIKGTGGGAPRAAARPAPKLAAPAPRAAESPVTVRSAVDAPAFQAPDYSVFVIRGATDGDPSYFVLMPAGQQEDGTQERGFLPVPPQDGLAVTADFQMDIPGGGAPYTLEQYDPVARTWVARGASANGVRAFSWAVKWDTVVAAGEAQALDAQGGEASEDPTPHPFTLRQYLRNAFIVTETAVPGDPDAEPIVTPVRDPAALPSPDLVEDDRVHNPTDAAFEAAVRGAMEQFRGSPYFRRDPSSEYEQLLQSAYQDDTTIYSDSGTVGDDNREATLGEQQAHELRGMIIHDLVADLRDYATVARGAASAPPPPDDSIPFAMGLVFRVTGTPPAWLTDAVATGGPTLSQRLALDASSPSADVAQLRTFNVRSADFATNPPRFERVQQLTDASTIALAWDLVWPEPPAGDLTPAQRDPEHHLVNYLVRRRPLEGNDREVVFTLKGADTLHREPGGVMKRLRRRFQLVDHFDETPEDLALLPVGGKSYLYSITPVDFSDHTGRPLSLVATRFPTAPPAVPVDGEVTVHYVVDAATLDPASAVPPTATPPLEVPAALTVRWSESSAQQSGPAIPIETYRLIFRRETTLPIGSYGLDSSTQRPAETSLPTSNARPLPTDIKVVIFPDGPSDARVAEVSVDDLQTAGVLPAGTDLRWRPESWRIFFQTISLNGVPSSLAPLTVVLRVEAASATPIDPLGPPSDKREERRPAELEWLPKPMRFPLLPPEDELATVGAVHVPMPKVGGTSALVFDPALANVQYRAHPAGSRCVRFRWNQGPSGNAGYPLDLNAGYQLLELDADAHTTETFADQGLLAQAVRVLQDVQMIPADDLALVPSDTLAPSQWEAWYPSAVLRERAPGDRAEGSELRFGPWYSWRESILEWPVWPGLTAATDPGIRDGAFHPTLRALVALLSQTCHVDLQATPAMQPQGLTAFLKATAPAADPYGWGVLQRFGLSMAFRLRTLDTGEIVTGAALLGAVNAALPTGDPVATKHLHVELLFQPGRMVELAEQGADADGLLALVQLSLRPAFRQTRSYGRVAFAGRPGDSVEVAITLAANTSCSVIDQGNPAGGQVELSAGPGASTVLRRSVLFPIGGRTTLLFRGAVLPSVALVGKNGSTTPLSVEHFEVTDEHSTYFEIDTGTLAAELTGAAAPAASAWTAFRRYAESLSSTDPAVTDDQKIRVATTKDELAPVVADVAAWMQRFFDHGGGATPAGRPWVATAYPRAGSPAHAAPDASGRLTYDHLLEDPWAHTYRYYLRPYGRYDLLWQGLRASPLLFPGTPRLDEATPETTGGGLDVVLERTRPVAKPLVLSSARLDGPGTPASPAVPGATWEVIVAEHPEQTLVAHNQTLARQLTFRQIAYTLLREFAFPTWIDALDIALVPVPERYPLPPAALPAAPEHLDFGAPLANVDARTLDLPARIGNFQQGALALQWEGLPFYYEHRLLLVAQTTGTVSPVNEIRQRDFEYRTPDPISEMDLAAFSWTPPLPFGAGGGAVSVRGRVVNVTLRQLWDSLPAQAQARWPSERPDGTHRTPGWAPDLGVVYQLVERFSGNVEVQAELYFDEAAGKFARRQFGKHFLADINALTPPATGGTYSLAVTVQSIAQQQLSRAYTTADLSNVDAATRAKLSVDGKVLSFAGVMAHADRDQLVAALDAADAAAIRSMHDAWDAQIAVSEAPASIPAALADVVDFPEPVEVRLVWDGAMSAAEKAGLLALPGDDELKAALARLASAVGAGTGVISISAPLGPEPIPPGLQPRVTLARDAEGHAYTALRWSGNLADADAGALTVWPKVRALSSAVANLISTADATGYTITVPAPRPLPEELPSEIAQRLPIADTQLGWLGPAPTDDERAALLALEGDTGFVDARALLLAAIDAEQLVPLGPVVERPTQDSLPPELAQLQIGDDQLTWNPPPPPDEPPPDEPPPPVLTEAQRALLLALPGDQAFLAAIQALLAALAAAEGAGEGAAVPLAAFVPRPDETDLPDVLRSRLVIGADTLQWTSPAPNDAERVALGALVADDVLKAALAVLIPKFDVDRSVPMAAYLRRLRQADLPDLLDGQLQIAPTAITWIGRLHDPTWRTALVALPGDAPFLAAIHQILHQIDAQVVEVPFTVEVRPAPDALGSLTDKLIIGRALLRFHGLMARTEVPVIQSLFARAIDGRAVGRLYQATQSSGMRGRELQIRSRRGAAPPSALHPIPLTAL